MQDTSSLRIRDISPTLFFVHGQEGLEQAVDLTLSNDGPAREAQLHVCAGQMERRIELPSIASGQQTTRVYIPDLREPQPVTFMLSSQGQEQDRRTADWQPQRHWEVYLVHDSHHDLGYTDLPSNLLREHAGFLDDALLFCEQTNDWPEDARFRMVVEQGWSILYFLQNRPPEVVEKMVRYLREGRIEVTALLGNQTSELCSSEEQIRLTYPSFRIKRRWGVPVRTAELNDVPGLSWGLVSVLSGAGVRYFTPSIPDYYQWGFKVHHFWDDSQIIPRGMPGAFWWQGPDGSRVLLWYGTDLGLWTYDQAMQEVPQQLTRIAEGDYPHDLIRMRVSGGHRDNAPLTMRFSTIARDWNARWAYPRLIVSTNIQFFEQFEQVAGATLPTFRGELPNTDYTVGATSTAEVTGVNRLTHDTLAAAEKLATCASLVSDYPYPADTLAEAYDHMLLYDEHTWGMAHPMGPAQAANFSQKSQFAYRAAALAHDVLAKSTNRLADQVELPEEGYHLVVFNSLAHPHTDVVHAPGIEPRSCSRPMYWRQPPAGSSEPPALVLGTVLGRDYVNLPASLLDEPFELLDTTTGESVAYQVLHLDDPLAAREWATYRYALGVQTELQHKDLLMDPAHRRILAFVAQDVPALGFKTYRLVPTAERPTFASSLQVGDHSLENRFYRVTLDPQSGAVTSIYDKELEREWVDAAAEYGLNQLVVRSSQTGETTAPTRSTITQGEAGPVLASLVVRGDGLGCPQRTQEIILYDNLKRVDFNNRLLKDATPLLETYFAFPLAVEHPRFRYESSNSVIEPVRDQLPGSNTDSYAIQHWVHVGDDRGGVTWSSREAPVVALGQLWPMSLSQAHHGVTSPGFGRPFLTDPEQFGPGHIYSYALVSNFRTNFQPVQVGDMLFRYSLTSQESDWREGAAAFGWGVANPLQPVTITGPQQGPLAQAESFCQVDQSNVQLLTMKAAEDGDGLIVRLAEMAGQETTVTVTLPQYTIGQAVRTNLVEEPEGLLSTDGHSIRVTLPAHGIATVRCRGARRWPTVNVFASY